MKNIMGIAVSRSFMKMGIGRALLSSVEDWAKETGACGVRMVSGATRTGAHEFYRHCGYDGEKAANLFQENLLTSTLSLYSKRLILKRRRRYAGKGAA